MTKNSSSMTIWAGSDINGAAKQMLTSFFFGGRPLCWWNVWICSGNNVNYTRNGDVLQKKEWSTPEFPPLGVS